MVLPRKAMWFLVEAQGLLKASPIPDEEMGLLFWLEGERIQSWIIYFKILVIGKAKHLYLSEIHTESWHFLEYISFCFEKSF